MHLVRSGNGKAIYGAEGHGLQTLYQTFVNCLSQNCLLAPMLGLHLLLCEHMLFQESEIRKLIQ